jgi:transposase
MSVENMYIVIKAYGFFSMQYFNTIFNQVLGFVPYEKFRRLVGQHKSDHNVKLFDAWNHLVILLYAQATEKDSLREIEMGLKTHPQFWHHLGIQTVAKTTVAKVNSTRNPVVFEKLFYEILSLFQNLTSERTFSFSNPLYSLDSTTIQLCLSLCNWAKFRKAKGAFKLHVLFNNRLRIPEIVEGTTGLVSDITHAKKMDITLEAGSILVFDRGYLDFIWWKELDMKGYFFVTRPKKNTLCVVSKSERDLETDILSDDRVWIGDVFTPLYPKEIRRIRYIHPEKGELIFLTNNFTLKASDIALIYKDRWQIELFFKWIKQHLVIKSFLGTTQTAIMNQVWVAMIFYLIVAYIRFQARYPGGMIELTWMIKESLWSRRTLFDLRSLTRETVSKVQERMQEPNLTLF